MDDNERVFMLAFNYAIHKKKKKTLIGNYLCPWSDYNLINEFFLGILKEYKL